MLILSRKLKEGIIIGDGEITVRVVQIDGDTVKLAIEAPKSVAIHRQEVYEAIQAINQDAAKMNPKVSIPSKVLKVAQSQSSFISRRPQ